MSGETPAPPAVVDPLATVDSPAGPGQPWLTQLHSASARSSPQMIMMKRCMLRCCLRQHSHTCLLSPNAIDQPPTGRARLKHCPISSRRYAQGRNDCVNLTSFRQVTFTLGSRDPRSRRMSAHESSRRHRGCRLPASLDLRCPGRLGASPWLGPRVPVSHCSCYCEKIH
jgi:hypothetical protein